MAWVSTFWGCGCHVPHATKLPVSSTAKADFRKNEIICLYWLSYVQYKSHKNKAYSCAFRRQLYEIKCGVYEIPLS